MTDSKRELIQKVVVQFKLEVTLFSSKMNDNTRWIGYNPIQVLEASTFFPLEENLTSLNVEDIDLEDEKKDFFNTFTRLKHVYFKKFHYCTSYAPQVKICHPASDGVSSLHHLLSTPLLRSAVWGISCATCMGNTLVLWGRFTAKDENRVLSIVIRNLAVKSELINSPIVTNTLIEIQIFKMDWKLRNDCEK
ncbi:hypothetical protein TSAR_004293 [Trichomalopsis sarcophagae]|uniref:Uncharacterized protein n=1 Tax=Trichomalopsis sarcophagae TaxID=543379 RepID=A0A232EI51_9HYME|nr:hypothetical protein TSAR_004293 [Trichomalopsis sarcophagae]